MTVLNRNGQTLSESTTSHISSFLSTNRIRHRMRVSESTRRLLRNVSERHNTARYVDIISFIQNAVTSSFNMHVTQGTRGYHLLNVKVSHSSCRQVKASLFHASRIAYIGTRRRGKSQLAHFRRLQEYW